jgi:uncharacterized protein
MYARYAESQVRKALSNTRVVAISGPCQSGKTTLARRFTRPGLKFFNPDNQATRQAAKADPVAFIQEIDLAVIDEVQRAPELMLAIKQSVDEDSRPGRFLLTGSANLLTIKTVRDFLAGRIKVVPLYPLSRGERLQRKRPRFLEKISLGQAPLPHQSLSGETIESGCHWRLPRRHQASQRAAAPGMASRLHSVDSGTRPSRNRGPGHAGSRSHACLKLQPASPVS